MIGFENILDISKINDLLNSKLADLDVRDRAIMNSHLHKLMSVATDASIPKHERDAKIQQLTSEVIEKIANGADSNE